MNERQRAMLMILLESRGFLSSQVIADQLGCSEKTVRNDSKVLDQWLQQHTNVALVRKPNIGIKLEVSESERQSLLKSFFHTHGAKEEVAENQRATAILKWLLVDKKPLTLQKLAEKFYVNKAVIKKDLEKIEAFLAESGLTLSAKKKLGIEVEGTEQYWRLAISKLPDFLKTTSTLKAKEFWRQLFALQDIETVQHTLTAFNLTLANPYTEETLQSLTVHILIAIKRLKSGSPISLTEQEMTRLKQQIEYDFARTIIRKLEPPFAVHVPDREIAYISLYFLGGKTENMQIEKNNLDEDVQAITAELIDHLSIRMNIDFSLDDELRTGLHIHLQSAINRIRFGLNMKNPILEDIKRMFHYLFDAIIHELVMMNQKRSLKISEEEAAYLTLHFQASIERLQKKSGSNKKAIIVCPMGIGASALLRTKLERKFHSLDIINSVSIAKMKQYSAADLDFIITTVPIEHPTIPVIQVTPLLSPVEEDKLQEFITELNHNTEMEALQSDNRFPALHALIKPELIWIGLDFSHPYEVIEAITTKLVTKGYVETDYIESAMIREQHSSTNIGGGIAIPHGDPSYIKKSAIAVGVLKRPLLWGKEYVSLVLVLATKHEDYATTKGLFSDIGFLCDHPLTLTTLVKQKTPEDFLKNL
ncbi:BglG family transcription antiterminator [Bacillus sp. BRMEA1]|uniref:BglG family transcription antiterminator n=1 Tax=Neobacillus endophyticus TaxID=2738405 RepID=UPI001564552F|nr:BglG family transcription antiterminator [Neobacillus endophyticus]NRD76777.1 BglG family transcription antiterminator [Neobacillus endophyticus]